MGKTILTETQKKVLNILAKDSSFTSNFYFTGGSVLSEYYLHHRYSEDLDFFSEKEIDKLWLLELAKKINKSIGKKEVDIEESFNRNLIYFSTGKTFLKTEASIFHGKSSGFKKQDREIEMRVNTVKVE